MILVNLVLKATAMTWLRQQWLVLAEALEQGSMLVRVSWQPRVLPEGKFGMTECVCAAWLVESNGKSEKQSASSCVIHVGFTLRGSLARVPTLAINDGFLTIGLGPLVRVGWSMAGSLGLSLDNNNCYRASIACKMIVLWHGCWKAITLSWRVIPLLSLAWCAMFAVETQIVTIFCDPWLCKRSGSMKNATFLAPNAYLATLLFRETLLESGLITSCSIGFLDLE